MTLLRPGHVCWWLPFWRFTRGSRSLGHDQ